MLFLGWSAAPFLAYPLFIVAAVMFRTGQAGRAAFIVTSILLSCWQAILLLQTWKRRLAWMAIAVICLLHLTYDYSLNGRFGLWSCLNATYLVQTFILIAVRKRPVLWALLSVAILFSTYYFDKDLLHLHRTTRSLLKGSLTEQFLPQFIPALFYAHYILMGALASFLMPPCNDQEAKETL